MAAERDFYEVLGVERGASDADIKRAFRRLAQQWHPDVNSDPEADLRFKEINEAYQILSDPQRRQAYDMFGRAGVSGATGADPFAGAAGFGGFSDIFDAFFGGAMGGQARRARPQTGSDLRYDLRISFEEAVLGCEKEIEFPVLGRCDTCGGSGAKPGSTPSTCPQCNGRGEVRSVRQTMLGQMVNVQPCPRCHGEGRVIDTPCETCRGEGRTQHRRTLRVSIPAGIDEGHQVRLSNEGEAGPRGGTPGSLYVAVHVAAQLPLLLKGTFYEGWDPRATPQRLDLDAFVRRVEDEARGEPGAGPGHRADRIKGGRRRHGDEREHVAVAVARFGDAQCHARRGAGRSR